MYYSLLNFLACPICKHEITILIPEEIHQITNMRQSPANRMSPVGAAVGPLPHHGSQTGLFELLSSRAATALNGTQDFSRYIQDAVMVCLECQRWYPIRNGLPELLPDHLRDWNEDQDWLISHEDCFINNDLLEVYQLLKQQSHAWEAGSDHGARYKIAEMSVTKRNLPKGFFGPAASAPFNSLRADFSIDLLLRFGTTVQKLGCGINSLILDIGVGYAWTTEWLVRLGYRAIGLDICRDYPLAGLNRMQSNLPYLIIADVENLPLFLDSFDAVLSFDSFHHIPDRKRAMHEFDQVMKAGTKIAMVEPGKQHEKHPISIAVMQQHGILEIGFDESDLKKYTQDTNLKLITHYRTDAHPHDIFTIQKDGIYTPTSLSPRSLYADLDFSPAPVKTDVKTPCKFSLRIKNSGDTIWLGNDQKVQNANVRIGAHLYDSKRALLKDDFLEIILPKTLAPGEALEMICALPAIDVPGDYILEFDPLIDGLMWFKDFTYHAKDLKISIQGSQMVPDLTPELLEANDSMIISPERWNEVKQVEVKSRPHLIEASLAVLRQKGAIRLIIEVIKYPLRKMKILK